MPENPAETEVQPMLAGKASDVIDAPKSEKRVPWLKPIIFIGLW